MVRSQRGYMACMHKRDIAPRIFKQAVQANHISEITRTKILTVNLEVRREIANVKWHHVSPYWGVKYDYRDINARIGVINPFRTLKRVDSKRAFSRI